MFPYIDALRGCAIILVLLLHSSQVVPFDWAPIQHLAANGGKGVQLFYIVSSMTLAMSWYGRGSNQTLFYLRRYFRIAPLFYIAILAYVLVNDQGPQYWAPEGIQPWQVLTTAFFVHGFHPYSINSVVPGGWSIAVEVTFYAVFPWIITYCLNLRRSLTLFAVAVLVFYIGRMVLIRLMAPHFPESSQYLVQDFPYRSILGQLPIFLLGICVYHALKLNNRVVFFIGSILSTAGIIILSLAYFRNEAIFQKLGENPILSGIYLAGMVMLIAQWSPKNAFLEFVGKISYGSYLSNLGVIMILKWYGLPEMLSSIQGGGFLFFGFTCLAVFISSHILHIVIEEPGIQLGKKVANRIMRKKVASP